MQWKKIEDICDINSSSINSSENIDEIEYIDTSSLTKGVISETQKLHLSDAPSRAQRKVKNDTILYSTVRPNLCHYGILKNPSKNIVVSTGFTTLDIKDKSSYCAEYIYYLLTQQSVIDYLQTIAQNGVSAYPSINPSDIGNLAFDIPSIQAQYDVASVLSSLDRKIALNRSIIHNLEALARQLYDHWFVQFDFPDAHGRPYKSSGGEMVWNQRLKREIPNGWHCGALLDIAVYTNGLACQKFRPSDERKLPVIKIKEMHDGLSAETEFVKADIPASVKVYNGDVLFSWSASLEVMLWANGNGGLNQHIFKVTPKNGYPRSFYYYQLVDYIGNFKRMADARKTTMGHITQEHLQQSVIALPPTTVLPNALEQQLCPIFDAIVKNANEINSLTALRDSLLPLLMNGQVTVNSD